MSDVQTAQGPARVPFVTVLVSAVGLWLTYFLLVTARAEILAMDAEGEMIPPRVIATAFGIVITLGLWLILRLFDARPLWLKIAAALTFSMPAAMLCAQTNNWAFSELTAKAKEEEMAKFVEEKGIEPGSEEDANLMAEISEQVAKNHLYGLTDLVFGRYFLLLAWCALYLALLTGEKARQAERREQQFRNAAKAAELRSLRYQVNPHFLFNTLNSLSALVLTGKTQAAERMIQTLSTFYRRSLADDPTSDVTLREEFALQKMYLEIEAVRFPMRLRAEYDLPGDLADAQIPGLILQPLVENSVKHAVAPSHGQVTITLAAREEYGRLVVTVSDNGNGVAANDEVRPGFGIGLSNVRERLEARFGEQASIVSGPSPEGYATHIRLPILCRQEQSREAAE